MPARVLLLLLVLLLPFPGSAADLDRSDPSAVAEAFLTAFKARDLEALPGLVNTYNQQVFAGIAEKGETHPDYAEVFTGWRADAVDAWDGTIDEVRYDGDDAVVLFGDMPGEEVAVLVLAKEAGGWAVSDVNSPDRADFVALPQEP